MSSIHQNIWHKEFTSHQPAAADAPLLVANLWRRVRRSPLYCNPPQNRLQRNFLHIAMFAIARENATCDDSFDSSLQLLVIAAGAGRLPQMVIFRALQPVHSNTIMTFLAREPHREISEMIYWISGPRSG